MQGIQNLLLTIIDTPFDSITSLTTFVHIIKMAHALLGFLKTLLENNIFYRLFIFFLFLGEHF